MLSIIKPIKSLQLASNEIIVFYYGLSFIEDNQIAQTAKLIYEKFYELFGSKDLLHVCAIFFFSGLKLLYSGLPRFQVADSKALSQIVKSISIESMSIFIHEMFFKNVRVSDFHKILKQFCPDASNLLSNLFSKIQ
jgi:hypothetical protein